MWRIILAVVVLIFPTVLADGKPLVPCYFIFGDSLSDAGNNNRLITLAKANYSPYGIDFFAGPTGRFTNGLTFVDRITELLGIEGYIAPFTEAQGQEILKGVNYASGAAGIRPETSVHLGDRIWLDRQLKRYESTIIKLGSLVNESVPNYLSKCLYTVNIGSNDYVNNYFMPQRYPSKTLFTPDRYASLLIDQYALALKALYASGARKIAIFGLGQLGCIPAELLMNNATQCITEINDAVDIFNQKLLLLVNQLNSQLDEPNFTFLDISALQAAAPPAGLNTTGTCCKLRADYQCEPFVPPCPNRNAFVFMDGFHPTQVVNLLTAESVFISPSPAFVHPLDISQLVST